MRKFPAELPNEITIESALTYTSSGRCYPAYQSVVLACGILIFGACVMTPTMLPVFLLPRIAEP